jgi:predicted hydrocarbon binding protein
MLMLSKKMSFENGIVKLYGQNIIIFPPQSSTEYVMSINDNKGLIRDLYNTSKEAMVEYGKVISEDYKASHDINWVCDYVNLFGQGRIVYEDITKAPIGAVLLEDSPYVDGFKNKSNSPVDHIIRGMVAGILSAIFNKNFDAIETECVAINYSKCRLIIDESNNLKKKFNSIYNIQVGN